MKATLKVVRRNWLFVLCFLVASCALLVALCCFEKGELHIMLNQCHTSFWDAFFKHYSVVGEYVPYVVVFCLLFYRAGSACFLLASQLVSGIVVQIMKHIYHAPRPMVFFDLANHPEILPVVDGVKLHSSNSFPSGHTATFVVLFLVLSIVLNRKRLDISPKWRLLIQLVCVGLALLGAYSRIYLSQHFASDVLAGGVIGLLVTLGLVGLFAKLERNHPVFYNWRIPFLHNKN